MQININLNAKSLILISAIVVGLPLIFYGVMLALSFLSSASSSDIASAKRGCVNWISSEFDSVKYDAYGSFKRQQGDELIFVVWGKEARYDSTRSGVTCVYNMKTGSMKKPSALDQSYR